MGLLVAHEMQVVILLLSAKNLESLKSTVAALETVEGL